MNGRSEAGWRYSRRDWLWALCVPTIAWALMGTGMWLFGSASHAVRDAGWQMGLATLICGPIVSGLAAMMLASRMALIGVVKPGRYSERPPALRAMLVWGCLLFLMQTFLILVGFVALDLIIKPHITP